MRKIYDDIKSLGGDVLVVSFAPPQSLAAYLAATPQPFPVVCDPERKAYDAFGLGKARLAGFLRPGVVWHYLSLMFRGWMPGRRYEDKDVWQLGGDFVLDRAGGVTYAHPSNDAADRPTNAELLNALRKAADIV